MKLYTKLLLFSGITNVLGWNICLELLLIKFFHKQHILHML